MTMFAALLALPLTALPAPGPDRPAGWRYAPEAEGAPPAAGQAANDVSPQAATAAARSGVRTTSGFLSAAALLQRCQANAAVSVSYCYAYITGVHDTVRAYETWLRVREFCVPLRATQSDLRKAFVDYIARFPDIATGEASSVVVIALKDRFTCDSGAQAPLDRFPLQGSGGERGNGDAPLP